MKIKLTVLTLIALVLTGCSTTSVENFRKSVTEGANNARGIKNYKYERVDGEPDQRLVIIEGSTAANRNKYKADAVSGACPSGYSPDVLGTKDDQESRTMKVVIWCSR